MTVLFNRDYDGLNIFFFQAGKITVSQTTRRRAARAESAVDCRPWCRAAMGVLSVGGLGKLNTLMTMATRPFAIAQIERSFQCNSV
jgi:hypothetical protein